MYADRFDYWSLVEQKATNLLILTLYLNLFEDEAELPVQGVAGHRGHVLRLDAAGGTQHLQPM